MNKAARLAKGKSYKVDAKFKNFPLTFGIDNIEDYQEQCTLLSPFLVNFSIDTIYFTINGGDKKKLYTGGYWKTPGDICNALEKGLHSEGILTKKELVSLTGLINKAKGKSHKVLVKFDEYPVNFGLDTLDDFDEQCAMIDQNLTNQTANIISLSVDGTQVQRFRSGAIKPAEKCAAVRPYLIGQGFMPKSIAAIAANSAKYRYNFIAVLQSVPVPFGVNSLDEVMPQCLSSMDILGIQPSNSIVTVKFTGNPDRRYRTEGAKKIHMCEAVQNAVFGRIPSDEQARILKITGKYKIDVKAEGYFPLTFNIDSSEQLYGQCLNITDEAPKSQLSWLSYSINGAPEKKSSLRDRGDWKYFCRSLSTGLKLQ
jgi:hypothetical protein